MAKSGADEDERVAKVMTGGGLKQEWRGERKVQGTGMGRVVRWNRKAVSTVALGRATYKPGDTFWMKTHRTDAGNAGGMQSGLHTCRGC